MALRCTIIMGDEENVYSSNASPICQNNEPFDSISTFAELKWDGIRLIVSNMKELILYTKTQTQQLSIQNSTIRRFRKGLFSMGRSLFLMSKGEQTSKRQMEAFGLVRNVNQSYSWLLTSYTTKV